MQIRLRVVAAQMQVELVAACDQAGEQFVDAILFFVGPLADRFHQGPPALAQEIGSLDALGDFRSRCEKLLQIVVVKIRVGVLDELPLPRVVRLQLHVQAVVIRDAVHGLMRGWLARDGAHQLVEIFQLLQRLPALVARAPVQSRSEPHRERLRKILVGMALRIPVVQMNDIGATVRTRTVKLRRLLCGSEAKRLLPFLLPIELIGVGVGVRGLVAHQAQEPL